MPIVWWLIFWWPDDVTDSVRRYSAPNDDDVIQWYLSIRLLLKRDRLAWTTMMTNDDISMIPLPHDNHYHYFVTWPFCHCCWCHSALSLLFGRYCNPYLTRQWPDAVMTLWPSIICHENIEKRKRKWKW